MAYYDNISLEKGMYTVTGKNFTEVLEELDPSENYRNTELEGLDAFQRQLKRFDIKVSGPKSDPIAKFYQTNQSSTLFPEYIRRVVTTSMDGNNLVNDIVASVTYADSYDYRSIHSAMSQSALELSGVTEGSTIPETNITLNEKLVKLFKRGRVITASYESLKFQKIDVFSTILKQIGDHIAVRQFGDCMSEIRYGESLSQDITTINPVSESEFPTYADLINMYSSIFPYKMNVLVASPQYIKKILMMNEMRDGSMGVNFNVTGKMVTPFGAKLLRAPTEETSMIIGLDSRYTVEMIKAGDVMVEHDKLIDRQLERTVISCIAGYSKILQESSVELKSEF